MDFGARKAAAARQPPDTPNNAKFRADRGPTSNMPNSCTSLIGPTGRHVHFVWKTPIVSGADVRADKVEIREYAR